MAKYTIGLDFGTLSARAVLVDVATGNEVAESSLDYHHGVMDKTLPDGTSLDDDWALQHPQDYIDVLEITIPEIIRQSGVSTLDIMGVGVDFTACTILPVKADGTPLCFFEEYQSNPHAYVKLWKHHAAQEEANRINEIASQRNEEWLARYGGKVNSEWMVPKVLQILNEAPEIYEEADIIMEAADWIIWQLTGVETKNACCAGYKGNWSKREGYPSKDFFKALDLQMENLIEEKMNCPVSPLGNKAGEICQKAAVMTGLNSGTAVAIGIIDAHVFVPATKIDGPGKMLAIIGTSTCHMLLAKEEYLVPGISGVVEDGIYPGYFAYEAGQGCVGDHFAWFIDQCVPPSYYEAAKAEGKEIHRYLTEKAAGLSAGESGLVALDWWNGVRSVLVDADLSGMIVGMTLQTKPEEIYRALIEATAFGTRKIIETFRNNGVPVNEFYAAGGISQKNSLMMQIYSDVINMPVKISGSTQGGALGSAIFGAVAAGKELGGYDDVFEAAAVMGKLKDTVYTPIKENVEIYNKLYSEYSILHDYFGRGVNDVMKRLKEIKKRYY